MPTTDHKTVINLEQSTFAHKFADSELIHRQEFERVMKLVNKQLAFARGKYIKLQNRQPHYYNTISVFGERGTGKTSFLHSVLAEVEDKYQDVEVLGIIDPTIIEEKEHIFLLVVSIINERVKRVLIKNECGRDTRSFQQRRVWDEKLQRLAKGLPTLEKLGTDHKNTQWQSHEFIMERGLDEVYSAFNLERDFHELVECALEIIGKSAFLLALDDIDVDMKKGWDVLEMLRKYVTTPQILTLLSGNLKLYTLNVRKHQWLQLEVNMRLDPDKEYSKYVNELEGQYLLKILKSENRVHLYSILESIQLFAVNYIIEGYADKEMGISDVYNDILKHLGIRGTAQLIIFSNYLKSLSVRSQVQFMLSNKGKDREGVESVEAFLSRLYASNVDVELAVNNAQMLSLLIQRYIEEQVSSPDLYLLTPNNADDDINACLTAFTILFCKEVRNNSFLIFDFFVRMGYMRNVWLGLNQPYGREDFYDHIGLNQIMSLKNNVGLSISYCLAYDSQMSSHIPLYALAGKNKQDKNNSQNRFDYEVDTNANQGQNIIAYLPLSVMKFTDKNETRLYYSFYNLMAVIAEILKVAHDANQKESMKSLLMNLQLLRTYPIWNREGDLQTKFVDEPAFEPNYSEEVNVKEETGDNTLDKLVDDILNWSVQYNESIPPYLIGKIATRLYYTVQKIQEINLGEQMHRSVMAFLNACLIEEATEYYVKEKDGEGIDKLNLSNVITHDRYFRDNLHFIVRNKSTNKIKLTNWMIKCPLLWAFTNAEDNGRLAFKVKTDEGNEVVVHPLDNGLSLDYNVYKILKSVRIKDAPLIVFSAAKDKIHKTIDVLERVDYEVPDIINVENDIEEIATDINERQIFRNKVTKKMVRDFRKNFELVRAESNSQETLPPASSAEVSTPHPVIRPGKNLSLVVQDGDFKAVPKSSMGEAAAPVTTKESIKKVPVKKGTDKKE